MNVCILGIGSNIDAENNIRKALNLLKADFGNTFVSEMVTTKPIGIEDQPDFINGAVRIETKMPQNELQEYLKKTEDLLGRDRTAPKFGPRTIDLDIVIWNNKIVDNDFHTREFLQIACAQVGFKA